MTEQWVIGHPEGLLRQTAAPDFITPVRIFCEATGLDWDAAKDQGYYLAKVTGDELPPNSVVSVAGRLKPRSA